MSADDARLWLAQAHWERGRREEARQVAGDAADEGRSPEYAWMALHDGVTLPLVAELFPDLAALRAGRRLLLWRRTVTLADTPNGESLGATWQFLRRLAEGSVEPPPADHPYLRKLYEAAAGRQAVEAEE